MDANSEDILRILAIMFRGQKVVKREELERTLAFDMQWMNPSDAASVIDGLIETSWLVVSENGVSPGADTSGVTTPLGWFPRLDKLMKPEKNSQVRIQQEDKIPVKAVPTPKIEERKPESTSADPRASFESRLARFIANSSGIERKEVVRRAERKVLALGAVTKWMALSLVAKEQGLEMSEIVNQLSL